jgi:hypothetical protein
MSAKCPAHPIIPDLITLIIFDEQKLWQSSIFNFCPSSCYVVPLTNKYSPQRPVLKHLQSKYKSVSDMKVSLLNDCRANTGLKLPYGVSNMQDNISKSIHYNSNGLVRVIHFQQQFCKIEAICYILTSVSVTYTPTPHPQTPSRV